MMLSNYENVFKKAPEANEEKDADWDERSIKVGKSYEYSQIHVED